MGAVFRKSFTKPVPANAEVVEKKGQRFARWQVRGKVRRCAADVVDATVGEDRGVEVRGLLGVLVEPEVGRELGHGCVPPVLH